MNFPAQGLAIIGPILFIVLMIAFPVIGVFGGWKRAAYWGGGNLVFYLLGLGIWAGAHAALGNAMLGWLSSVIQDFPADKLKDFASSITAPIFFLIVVVAGNLFLLLNYYFWFKRVAKIRRKDDQANLDNNTLPSKKYRIISMVAGGVGMPILMLPTTLSATQAAMFVTTSAATRENNAFANGLYNGLAKLSESFGGLSYYGITKSAQDFDALWAAQGLKSVDIEIKTPGATSPTTMSVGEALSKTLIDGFGHIIDKAKDETKGILTENVNQMTESWNTLTTDAANIIYPIFNSESASKLIKEIVDPDTPIPMADTDIAPFLDGGRFDLAYQAYINGEPFEDVPFEEITRVPVSKVSFDNIYEQMISLYNYTGSSSDNWEKFETKIGLLLGLILEVK